MFLFCWTLPFSSLTIAQTVEPLSDRVGDVPGMVLVANDLKVVRDDIERLFVDLGFGVWVREIEQMFPVPEDKGIASSAGALIYGDAGFGQLIIELVIDDGDQLLKSLNVEGSKDGEWFEIGDEIEDIVPLPIFFRNFFGVHDGQVIDSRLFLAPPKSHDKATAIRDAPRLSEKPGDAGQQIIDQSGLTLIGVFDNEIPGDPDDLKPMLRTYGETMTEAELEWVREFIDVAYSADVGLLGLKYHETHGDIQKMCEFFCGSL